MAIFEVVAARFQVLKTRLNAKPEVVVKQREVNISEISQQVPYFGSRCLSVVARQLLVVG